MSWFRLDDNGAFHRKVLKAGNEAYGAWCRMGQHSSGQLADGFIDVEAATLIAQRPAVIEKLITAELLERADGGYQIHDFLEYNPSAEQVLATRRARSEAGKRGGTRSVEARTKPTTSNPSTAAQAIASASAQAIASGVASTDPKQTATPSRPDPTHTHPDAAASPDPLRGDGEAIAPPKPLAPWELVAPPTNARPRPAPVLDGIDRYGVNGADAMERLRVLSENRIRASGGVGMWSEFGKELGELQRQHKRTDLVDVLAAWAKAGGLSFLGGRLATTSWFLENRAKQLSDCIEEAIEWESKGKPPIAKRDAHRARIAPPAPPSAFARATETGEAVTPSADELTAALERRRAQGE